MNPVKVLRRLVWAGGAFSFAVAFVAAVGVKCFFAPTPSPRMTDREFAASLQRTRDYWRAQRERGDAFVSRAHTLNRETETMQRQYQALAPNLQPDSPTDQAYRAWAARLQWERTQLLNEVASAEKTDPWERAR